MNKVGDQIPIHLDEETDLHYIRGVSFVLFENGVKVDKSRYDNRLAKKMTTADVINEARKRPENCDWDFAYARNSHKLARKAGGKKMDIAPIVDVAAAAKAKIAEVVAAAPELPAVPSVKDIKAATRGFFSKPYADVILMLLTVGLLCVVMSIYHTRRFLVDAGKGPVVATIAAVSMIIFSSSAYTAARHVWGDRGIGLLNRIVYSGFLIITGSSVILYSVFSTTNVSYDQYRNRHRETVKATVENDTSVNSVAARIADKDMQISQTNDRIAQYTQDSERQFTIMSKPLPEEITNGTDEENTASRRRFYSARDERLNATRAYNKVQTSLQDAYKALDTLSRERETLLKEQGDTTKLAVEKVETAYTMVASRVGVSEGTLQFIVYVIPAAFFDVVAPFAVSIVLRLKDRRRELEAGDEGRVGREESGGAGTAGEHGNDRKEGKPGRLLEALRAMVRRRGTRKA